MKIYPIDTPEKLDMASDMVKWSKDREKVLNVLKKWRDGAMEPVITLEVSRNAHLFITENGKKSLLATMYVVPARKWAREVFEREDH